MWYFTIIVKELLFQMMWFLLGAKNIDDEN